MSLPAVKFNVQDRPEFFKELRKRVNGYFKENNISKHANTNMVIKTIFMLSLYFAPLVLMITGVVSGLWPVLGMWALMGLGMSGIGMSVMHDANHGSYSQNRTVNQFLGSVILFIGGFRENWKIQHNVLHHSFTNIHQHDEDLDSALLRLSPNQPLKKGHRFQALYGPFLYGLLTVQWSLPKDFMQIVRYNKNNLLAGQGLTFKKALRNVILYKVGYYSTILVLPMIFVDLPWYQILLGYFIMHYICGLILSFIFQLAHVLEETNFYKNEDHGSMENNWAIHQMHTTANFAHYNLPLSWFIGGLNYQVEHHLFPNICHVHYRKISKIVKQTAEEFKVPYKQHKTLTGALRSHFALLHGLGTGSFDKKLAKATAA